MGNTRRPPCRFLVATALREKGGKEKELPVHHKLEELLDPYLKASGLEKEPESPLFPAALVKTGKLSRRPDQRSPSQDLQSKLPALFLFIFGSFIAGFRFNHRTADAGYVFERSKITRGRERARLEKESIDRYRETGAISKSLFAESCTCECRASSDGRFGYPKRLSRYWFFEIGAR
jgi:hypothetical protein